MSGRDRDRDRDRAPRSQPQPAARTNEYFVPKNGIDREVITADICRYLGNDALVRPGTYEDPVTRVVQQGYFITAYRNLTTAMIADLKQDSERWDAERRQTASRGQPSNGISSRDSNGIVRNSNTPIVEYRSSTTHQSRQYYGPTEASSGGSQGFGASPGYTGAAVSAQQGVYDNGYPSQPSYAQPAPGYAPQGYPTQDNYYVAGADLTVDQQRSGRAPVPQSGTIPRTGPAQYANPSYQQPDARGYPAYPSQSTPSPAAYAQGPSQQPSDPFYPRGTYGDPTPDMYDGRGYQDAGAYSQAQIPSATATSGSSRRDRDRDADRDSRHHRSTRR